MILLFAAGCNVKTAEQRYVDYVNDPANKILQQIKIGDITASIKWMNAEYRSLINRQRGLAVDPSDDLYYFNVKFQKIDGEKPVKEKLLYLNFDMHNDFSLLTHRGALMPSICQKIENGVGGSYEYMLAFEKTKDKNEDFTVVYNDKIFGIGTIEFVYNQKDFKKLPKLKSHTSE